MSAHRTAYGYVADADALTIADWLTIRWRGYRIITDAPAMLASDYSAPCDSASADAERAERAGARVWRARSGELRTNDIREHTRGHIPYRGADLFSWGPHFPLARYIPRNGRAPALFILNGDRWNGSGGFSSSTTWSHQTMARHVCEQLGARYVVIPFEALAGAGIDIDTIRLIDSRPETDWTETRETIHLNEVPRDLRRVDVTRTARTLDDIPEGYRFTYRSETDTERDARVADAEREIASLRASETGYAETDMYRARARSHSSPRYERLPRLPDADGFYRWTVPNGADRERDADGFYRWTVRLHRLGEALFSGARRETWREFPAAGADTLVSLTDADRAANKRAYADAGAEFDAARERGEAVPPYLANARDRDLELARYCDANPFADNPREREHIASIDGATCEFCGRASIPEARERMRRARYLSAFDMEERAPQYFLAEVPRGSGATVAEALDALAPRAVHAAIARGLDVKRQGDVFFIETPLTDADLSARGIVTRARLTQWTRDAKARTGEVGYAPKPSRVALRRRELWTRRRAREIYERAVAECTAGARGARDADAARERGRLWTALRADRALYDARKELGASEYETVSALDKRERELKASAERGTAGAPFPKSADGARARWAKLRAKYETDVSKTRAELKTALLGPAGTRRYAHSVSERAVYARDAHGARFKSADASRYDWQGSAREQDRRAHARRITDARAKLDALLKRGVCDANGWTSRAHARDAYRAPFSAGPPARVAFSLARAEASARFAPETEAIGSAPWQAKRERVRAALSIYGTSHAATEVARVKGGACYARGIARHAPELARGGNPEHMPKPLGDGSRWYLAVRNTVPRLRDVNRAPRRARRATDSR